MFDNNSQRNVTMFDTSHRGMLQCLKTVTEGWYNILTTNHRRMLKYLKPVPWVVAMFETSPMGCCNVFN